MGTKWNLWNLMRQNLERHLATEFGVASGVHLSHTARTQLGGDLVVTESSTDY